MECKPDDCSVVVASLSLLLLEIKEKFSLDENIMPLNFEEGDIPQIFKKLRSFMQENSLPVNNIRVLQLKHYLVLKLTKLRQESPFCAVIPNRMRCADLEITLKKLEEISNMCFIKEKTGSCDLETDRLQKEQPDAELATKDSVEIEPSETKVTAAQSKQRTSRTSTVANQIYDDVQGTHACASVLSLHSSSHVSNRSKDISLKRTFLPNMQEQNCCKKQCLESICQDFRYRYLKMTKKEKIDYVKTHVDVIPNKTTKTLNRERNRAFYRKYKLPDGRSICKTAFCTVLGGVSSDFIDKNIDRPNESSRYSKQKTHDHDRNATGEADALHTDLRDSIIQNESTTHQSGKMKQSCSRTCTCTCSQEIRPTALSQESMGLGDDGKANANTSVMLVNSGIGTKMFYPAKQSLTNNNSTVFSIAPNAVQNQTTNMSLSSSNNVTHTYNMPTDHNLVQNHPYNLQFSQSVPQINTNNVASSENVVKSDTRTMPSSPTVVENNTSNMPSNCNVVQNTTQDMHFNHDVLQSQTSNMPPSHNVILSHTSNMPSNQNVVQSHTSNMPSSHDVVQSHTSNMPSSHDVVQSHTNNMPSPYSGLQCNTNSMVPCQVVVQSNTSKIVSTHNVDESQNSNVQPIFDVVQPQCNNMQFSYNMVQSYTSNKPSSHDVVQSHTNKMPSSHDVIQSHSSNMPSSHDVVQSHTNNMPSSHDVVQSHSSNMPSSHDVVQMHTSNMPSSQNVVQSHISNMPSSHDVVQCHTNNMPSSHGVVQTYTRNMPSSHGVVQIHTSNMPSSHDVVRSHTSNMPSSHDVVQSHTSNMPSSHDVVQSHTSNMPSSHDVVQSHTSNMKPVHDFLQRDINKEVWKAYIFSTLNLFLIYYKNS